MYLFQVLLKGANGDELKKVKHVVQYGVFAAYHLALETSFLADEGASLPELPLKSPITVALPDKPSSIDRSISTIPGFTVPVAGGKPQLDQGSNNVLVLDPSLLPGNPSPSKMDSPVTHYTSKGPYSQMTEMNASSVDLKQLPAEKGIQAPHGVDVESGGLLSPLLVEHQRAPYYAFEGQSKVGFEPYDDDLMVPYNGYGTQVASDGVGNYMQINDRKTGNQLGSSDLNSFHQDNHRDDQASSKEEFPPSPSNHQSILVSLSTRCVWKGTVCDRAHLLRIKYYGSFDKPLGRFLRDRLFDQVRLFRSLLGPCMCSANVGPML